MSKKSMTSPNVGTQLTDADVVAILERMGNRRAVEVRSEVTEALAGALRKPARRGSSTALVVVAAAAAFGAISLPAAAGATLIPGYPANGHGPSISAECTDDGQLAIGLHPWDASVRNFQVWDGGRLLVNVNQAVGNWTVAPGTYRLRYGSSEWVAEGTHCAPTPTTTAPTAPPTTAPPTFPPATTPPTTAVPPTTTPPTTAPVPPTTTAPPERSSTVTVTCPPGAEYVLGNGSDEGGVFVWRFTLDGAAVEASSVSGWWRSVGTSDTPTVLVVEDGVTVECVTPVVIPTPTTAPELTTTTVTPTPTTAPAVVSDAPPVAITAATPPAMLPATGPAMTVLLGAIGASLAAIGEAVRRITRRR